MRVQVYRLRENGLRLARELVIERGPVAGELLLRERLPRSGIHLATLVIDADGNYGLPPLDRAALHRITAQGLMVYGQEVTTRGPGIKTNATYRPQAWWCLPISVELVPPLPQARVVEKVVPQWQQAIANAK
jgi:hypothetical protein